MLDVRCVGRSRIPGSTPTCRQLMCRVSEDATATIEIKCPRCKLLNRVVIAPDDERMEKQWLQSRASRGW